MPKITRISGVKILIYDFIDITQQESLMSFLMLI